MMNRIFKILVATSLLLYLVWYASFFFSIQIFGAEVTEVLLHGGRGAWLPLPFYFGLILPIIWAVVTVGLFFYKSWARTLFVFLLGFSFFQALSGGLVIMMGPQYAIAMLTSLLDGGLCFMSFFSSVACKFDRKPSSN